MKQILQIFNNLSIKRLLFFCVMLAVKHMTAHQKAVYTQYILNNYMIDPANTGIENYTDVKISKRN